MTFNSSHDLPDSKFTPFFVINDETGEIILKKSVAELGKLLTNGNIFLLPVKAAEIVSEAEKTSSMSTTVQIAFVVMTAKSNIHQDFLNRSVSFILNDAAVNVQRRKDDIEKGLTQITGGHVNVYEIHEAQERPGSVVHAWILYPSRGTVDLRNLQKAAAAILGLEDDAAEQESTAAPDRNREKNSQIHTASIIHYEYQTLVWVLIFFIILTIVFLLTLCCIWFWCCRSPSQLKVWLSGNPQQSDKAAASSHVSGHELNTDKTSLINQQSRRERGSGPASSVDSEETGKDGYANAGFRYHDKVKRIRPPRQTRAKLKQGPSRSVTTMDTNDMVYPEDPDTRASKLKSMESSFDDDYEPESYQTGGAGSRTKGRRTEIMYIRSPPESYDEQFRNVSENEVTGAAQDDAQDGISNASFMRRSSTKQVSFVMQRMNTPGREAGPDSAGGQKLMKRQRSSSNETIGSVDLRQDQAEDSASESMPAARTRGIHTSASVSSSSSRSAKHVTAVSVPGTVDEIEVTEQPLPSNHLVSQKAALPQALDPKPADEDKSDSDSGIGRGSKVHGDLTIKNKSLMEKKNVFTIAYDNVRTQRIRTSESGRESL